MISSVDREPEVNSEGNRPERDQVAVPRGPQVTTPIQEEAERSPPAQTFYIEVRLTADGLALFRVEREVRKKPKRAGRACIVSGVAEPKIALKRICEVVLGRRFGSEFDDIANEREPHG